jgi:hypothetical protein
MIAASFALSSRGSLRMVGRIAGIRGIALGQNVPDGRFGQERRTSPESHYQ